MAARSGCLAPTPPLSRTGPAVGCAYAFGNGSSENHESAMKRPVPEGFMTSPPQSVSIPRIASATKRSRAVTLDLLFLACPALRFVPDVEAQADEEQGGDGLRDRKVVVEGRLDLVFGVPREQAQRRAEDAAQGAARHQTGGDDHAALADGGAPLSARCLRAPAQEVGPEAADERRRVQLQGQVHAERDDQRGH